MKSFLVALVIPVVMPLSAQEVKPIPIYQTPPRTATVLEINGENYSMKVDPATAASVKTPVSVSTSLQQQMRLAIQQAIAPNFAIVYRAEAGFKTMETSRIGQEEVTAMYLGMLQKPALSWKPRDGTEVEFAYETADNLNQNLATEHIEAVVMNARMKFSENTSVTLAARSEEKIGFDGEETSRLSFKTTLEQAIPNTPLKLVLGPGYQQSVEADGSHAIRAFVDSAVIWKVDEWTVLTMGSGIGGSGLGSLGDSLFVLVQHKVLPGTALELKAALLRSGADLPDDGFAISAQSTVALAEALSAGLSVRYKMAQNPSLARIGGETFLSLSINGSF